MADAFDAVRRFGDPVLRAPAAPVTAFDRDLRRLVRRMREAMHHADGVGLAANQIGVSLRVFVLDCDGVRAAVVNPTLTDLSEEVEEDGVEGCLSWPGHHYPTPRSVSATVHGWDERGEPLTVTGNGLLARCLQHEVDHLDGVVFLDRLTGRTRRQALRELRRAS